MEDTKYIPVEAVPRSRSHRRCSRRTLIWAAVAAIVVIALAVGLGVGLGLRGSDDGDDNDDNSSPQPTSTTSPNATTPAGNGTVWQPAVNSSWQIILLNPIALDSDAKSVSPNVSIYDIDLFTNSNTTISTLHDLGKKVICYFSAGSYEPDRPDSSDFKSSDLGKELDGWPGEKWLDLNSTNVRSIMAARIKLASEKGCDGIDPDNVDGYDNENGLGLTEADSINFMQYLRTQADKYSLAMGLKNAGGIVPNVTSIVQFSVNEQCVQYSECDTYSPFIDAGKPVFHIEYPDGAPNNIKTSAVSTICSDSGDGEGSENFSTVIKKMNLDGWVEYCGGLTANTTLQTSS